MSKSDSDSSFDSDFNFNSDIDDEDDENSNLDSLIFFALSFLTDYIWNLLKNEILSKLNTFAKNHDFALII